MNHKTVSLFSVSFFSVVVALGCGGGLEKPEKALIITGGEELVGANVIMDGVVLGNLEVVDRPPEILIWAVSKITGSRGPYEDDHGVVALIHNLEGTVPGAHSVTVDHPDYQPINMPYIYPDDLVEGSKTPGAGVVFLPSSTHDLVRINKYD